MWERLLYDVWAVDPGEEYVFYVRLRDGKTVSLSRSAFYHHSKMDERERKTAAWRSQCEPVRKYDEAMRGVTAKTADEGKHRELLIVLRDHVETLRDKLWHEIGRKCARQDFNVHIHKQKTIAKQLGQLKKAEGGNRKPIAVIWGDATIRGGRGRRAPFAEYAHKKASEFYDVFLHGPEPHTSQECPGCGGRLKSHVIPTPPKRRVDKKVASAKELLRKCQVAVKTLDADGSGRDDVHAKKLKGAKAKAGRAKAHLDKLVANAKKAKSSPFRKPLPETHVSRDVKECRHCGIVKGKRLYNRDDVGGRGIGFRTFVEKICGFGCPGRFHPAKTVRKTSWAKNAAMNATVEAEKYLAQAGSLIEAERKAWKAAYGESAPHPRLGEAGELLKEAETIVERIDDSKSWLVQLSRDRHQAYAKVVAEEEKKFEGKSWKDNPMRSNPSHRKQVFERAKQTSQQTVMRRLLKLCPARADRVVYTAEKRRDAIVEDTDQVKSLLHKIAAILRRNRRRREKDVGYRFSDKKTAFKATREGVTTRSMSSMSRVSRVSRIPEASTRALGERTPRSSTTPGRSTMTRSMTSLRATQA